MGVLNLQVTVGERTGATVSLSPRGMVTRGTLHFLFLRVMKGRFSVQVTVKSSVSREIDTESGQSPDNPWGPASRRPRGWFCPFPGDLWRYSQPSRDLWVC